MALAAKPLQFLGLWENRYTLSVINFPSNKKVFTPNWNKIDKIELFHGTEIFKIFCFGRMKWNISKIPSHRASWLNILGRNHTRPWIRLLLRVGSSINQQGGPVCPAGRLESVRVFRKINVFLQNDLISLYQNFPQKTNPSEHLSNSIVHALHRNNLLFVCQCLPYSFAEFMATPQWVLLLGNPTDESSTDPEKQFLP